VSRLQKSVRNGRLAPQTLCETILKVHKTPPYVSKDMPSRKSSSSRYLLWRLFIITIEDGRGYL
jgi:hypothetical protein